MVPNRRQTTTPLATLSYYLLSTATFPFFHSAKAFSSSSLRSHHHPVHAAGNGSPVVTSPHCSQIKTSVHPPSTGNIMELSSKNNGGNDDEVCVRILCLHGKGGNGPSFVNTSLKPLRSLVEQRAMAIANSPTKDDNVKISFHWEELTAPYEIMSGEDAGGYSWWTMPPGVRSYNAPVYEGFEKSEALVMDALFPTESSNRNFDFILGHSQGAILTAALISIQERLRNTEHGPLGYILNGVAWPNPFTPEILSLAQETTATETLPKVAFIMGNADTINPTESAMQVYDSYLAARFDVLIVNHEGGHSVPLGKDDDSIRALNEVVDWIFSVVVERKDEKRKTDI